MDSTLVSSAGGKMDRPSISVEEIVLLIHCTCGVDFWYNEWLDENICGECKRRYKVKPMRTEFKLEEING